MNILSTLYGLRLDKFRASDMAQLTMGDAVTTGTDGVARFHVQAGHGGQGKVSGKLFVDELGFYIPIDFDLTQPCLCGDCCVGSEEVDVQDTAEGAMGLYAGERRVRATDLDIPGRGFGFEVTRSYRSQASHLRSAASGDFGVDWAISYIDDRLIPDGHNVIVFRPTLRTDVFLPSEASGRFIAPMELYERLTLNEDGSFELRSWDGMVKTYRDSRASASFL